MEVPNVADNDRGFLGFPAFVSLQPMEAASPGTRFRLVPQFQFHLIALAELRRSTEA